MKNKKSIVLAALLLSGAVMGAFSGCTGEKTVNKEYDATKANLSLAVFDGGVGDEWLQEAAARFEQKYANATHFQEGRTGVKISIDPDKNKYAGNKLAESASLTKDVYFTEAVEYYDFVNNGLVADITDVMKASMSDYGESRTIEEKIDPSLQSYMTAKDGKYYMVPFYDGFYGFIYDIDLFEKEGFYLDKDGDFIGINDEGFATSKANGPDGKEGTYDDGLPATYDDMIKLCDQIVAKGCVPFCYAGNQAAGYVNRSFFGYAADYEGYESFLLNKTFSGTTKVVKNITDDGSRWGNVELEDITINKDNGYEVLRQPGRYYSLKMQEALFGSPKYVGGAWNMLDFLVAQSDFIKSKYTAKPYAMLVEGIWWENEASAAFDEIANIRNETKADRRFGLMPIPKVSAEMAGEQTLFSVNASFGFINKKCENMELAKEFMRFLHTDAEMSKFSAKTSIPRSLLYDVTEEDKATATPFGKSLIEMRENSKVVYPYSGISMVINNSANFENNMWFNLSLVNGRTQNSPFDAFKDNRANAVTYFNGLKEYQKSLWSSLKK